MFKTIYLALASLVLAVYGIAGGSGWEFGNPQRQIVPADTRRSPGWLRTGPAHFWYSGYRGGK